MTARWSVAVDVRRIALISFAVLTAAILVSTVGPFLALAPSFNGYGGIDYDLYVNATDGWLAGGAFYGQEQLTGAYSIEMGNILYPPVALWLLVPFTVVPAFLWLLAPLAIMGWGIWRLRPDFLV